MRNKGAQRDGGERMREKGVGWGQRGIGVRG